MRSKKNTLTGVLAAGIGLVLALSGCGAGKNEKMTGSEEPSGSAVSAAQTEPSIPICPEI